MSAVGRWGGFFCYVCANWLLLLLHNVPSRRRRPSVCLCCLPIWLIMPPSRQREREEKGEKGGEKKSSGGPNGKRKKREKKSEKVKEKVKIAEGGENN